MSRHSTRAWPAARFDGRRRVPRSSGRLPHAPCRGCSHATARARPDLHRRLMPRLGPATALGRAAMHPHAQVLRPSAPGRAPSFEAAPHTDRWPRWGQCQNGPAGRHSRARCRPPLLPGATRAGFEDPPPDAPTAVQRARAMQPATDAHAQEQLAPRAPDSCAARALRSQPPRLLKLEVGRHGAPWALSPVCRAS